MGTTGTPTRAQSPILSRRRLTLSNATFDQSVRHLYVWSKARRSCSVLDPTLRISKTSKRKETRSNLPKRLTQCRRSWGIIRCGQFGNETFTLFSDQTTRSVNATTISMARLLPIVCIHTCMYVMIYGVRRNSSSCCWVK